MRIGQSLSIFVMQLGMKLISASGAIRIQAQNDDIEIIAAKRLRLVGLKDVSIEGPQVKITAQSAGVEYGGGITAKTTGSNTQHAASHVMDGPASVSPQNAIKSGKADHDQKVQLFWQGGGEPIANRQYRLKLEDGRVLSGKTDASGFAQHVKSEIGFARYKLELLPEQ
jgi:type VI secretion system secreted protein VgrG